MRATIDRIGAGAFTARARAWLRLVMFEAHVDLLEGFAALGAGVGGEGSPVARGHCCVGWLGDAVEPSFFCCLARIAIPVLVKSARAQAKNLAEQFPQFAP